MSADPYSPLVRELFASPHHVASESGAPAEGASVYRAGQGVRLRLNARETDGGLDELTFRAQGCPHFLAACEWLCRELAGKPVEALNEWQPAQIMQTLHLPVEKTGRILILEDVARELGSCLIAPPPLNPG